MNGGLCRSLGYGFDITNDADRLTSSCPADAYNKFIGSE